MKFRYVSGTLCSPHSDRNVGKAAQAEHLTPTFLIATVLLSPVRVHDDEKFTTYVHKSYLLFPPCNSNILWRYTVVVQMTLLCILIVYLCSIFRSSIEILSFV